MTASLSWGMGMTKKIVAVNERGIRIGEDHQNAKLTNHEVDLIRELGEELDARGRCVLRLKDLAEKFEVSIRTIRDVLSYRSYSQAPVKFKRIEEAQDRVKRIMGARTQEDEE